MPPGRASPNPRTWRGGGGPWLTAAAVSAREGRARKGRAGSLTTASWASLVLGVRGGRASGPWRRGRGSRCSIFVVPPLRDFPTAPVGFLAFSVSLRERGTRETSEITTLLTTGGWGGMTTGVLQRAGNKLRKDPGAQAVRVWRVTHRDRGLRRPGHGRCVYRGGAQLVLSET